MSDTPRPVDLGALRREIDDEVAARRASGDFPPALESELDSLFARYAPAAAGEDFDAAITEANRAATFEPTIPVDSDKPGGRAVKGLMARGLGWYHSFLTEKLVEFAGAMVHSVKLLGQRMETVESAVASSRRSRELSDREAPRLVDGSAEVAVQALASVAGRVMVGESGDAGLLGSLLAAGVDAYGVDPRRTLVDAATARDLEVRADTVVNHLKGVDAGALAGVVFTGFVERHPIGDLVEVLDRAVAALAVDGRVVVVSAAPIAHQIRQPIASDLATGRPLHAATWEHLLFERGFTATTTPIGSLLPDATTTSLSELLGPLSYVVVGRRADAR